MAEDEQEESHDKADGESHESELAEDERTAEELGEELVALLEANAIELTALREEVTSLRAELASYARNEHEHPHEHAHEHNEYARNEHEHARDGDGDTPAPEAHHESAPRSNHPYYREWPPWKH